MAQTRADRLIASSMVPELAKEVVALVGNSDQTAVAALTPVTTPDATDAASVITLANANKAKINEIIAALAP